MDVRHKSLEPSSSLRAKVNVVGVLVYVQGENRHPASDGVGVISRPLIYQRAFARLQTKKHPP